MISGSDAQFLRRNMPVQVPRTGTKQKRSLAYGRSSFWIFVTCNDLRHGARALYSILVISYLRVGSWTFILRLENHH